MARISRSRRCRWASGDPQDLGNFFLERDDCLRPRSFRCSRRFSASSCFTRGSTGRGVGPRRRPRIACRAPASRCRRQFVKSDEYNLSRRSRAPTSPGRLHASTSLRMRSRYAGGKRRRSTFAGTSGSGSLARDPVTGPGPPVALRAPSAPGPVIGSISTTSGMRVISPTFPAPTLISSGRLSHRLLAQGGTRARRAPDSAADRTGARRFGAVHWQQSTIPASVCDSCVDPSPCRECRTSDRPGRFPFSHRLLGVGEGVDCRPVPRDGQG